ncbi:MAG: tetratricopeptide repeat protein [Lactobacillus crispatus]|jgi:tetratricopeptide (TPR) repeat protein|uniref:tetratricopeptide repeat protein n=1 Tax=Lactobacillus crispatus TaxID=47770 RepID=UPI0018AC3AF8|nr:tetratricopeptide repeat protein [Lactobacillus crispatus]MCH4004976.1 tetratricopeptide repeat protein [Lactobacillus crispatus]MCI1335789.1 tetratricopeptide repeat protein [Lactobacillus crispatus]MCI1365147.1 tetratricopeptide repeat protein [Lactobacillus crispatus]MCI1493128.1 tetratricopeptide repeat protein [Lactobacillus crispatus]MCI1538013.1 tetratricopeptide repeat protein [Lactobacillus crispatus]
MDQNIAQLYDEGKVEQAIHLLIKKIDQHPQQVANYLQLSTYLIEQGSLDQAQKLLEQAQHLVKEPQELNYNLAVCYYMQGDFDKALALLDQIPNDDLTLYQKALTYLKLGQGQKALAYALTIKKIDERIQELLGDIWLSLGENQQAQQMYLAIPDNKKNAKVYFLLGVTTLEKDRDQAQKYFAQAKQMDAKYYQQAMNQYASIMKMLNDKEKKNHE